MDRRLTSAAGRSSAPGRPSPAPSGRAAGNARLALRDLLRAARAHADRRHRHDRRSTAILAVGAGAFQTTGRSKNACALNLLRHPAPGKSARNEAGQQHLLTFMRGFSGWRSNTATLPSTNRILNTIVPAESMDDTLTLWFLKPANAPGQQDGQK